VLLLGLLLLLSCGESGSVAVGAAQHMREFTDPSCCCQLWDCGCCGNSGTGQMTAVVHNDCLESVVQ
jgi:hypothetical protein